MVYHEKRGDLPEQLFFKEIGTETLSTKQVYRTNSQKDLNNLMHLGQKVSKLVMVFRYPSCDTMQLV